MAKGFKGFSMEWLAKHSEIALKEVFKDKSPNPPSVPISDVKKSKYRNEKVNVDGIKFDSKKEYQYWLKLKILEKADEITDLKLQVSFPLVCDTIIVNDVPVKFKYKLIKEYIADFVYIEKGIYKVIDVKGWRTKEYRKKKFLMKELYGVEITEV